MSKSKSAKTDKIARPNSDRRVYLMALVVFLVLVVVYDLAIGGNIAYYKKWVQCGQKPVTINATYKGPIYYEEGSAIPDILRPKSFCTPLEAEKAGYSATPDSYSFPNLKKTNQ